MDKLTLENAWIFYRDNVLVEKKQKSQTTEQGRWKHIRHCLGSVNVEDINPLMAYGLKGQLQKRGLSPQSVQHCISLVTRVIYKSKKLGLYKGEVPEFEKPNFDNKRIRFLSKKEASNLIQHLRFTSPQWSDIVYLAIMTGLRAGEIFNLRESNFDEQNNFLRFYDEKTVQNRCLPLNTIALKILKKNIKISCGDYIFVNEKGMKWSQVSKKFNQAVDFCNLNKGIIDYREKVVFHTLRHTFASWLVQSGVPIQVVASLLGHRNIKTTMRYAHLAPDQGRAAMARIGRIKL